MANYLTGAVRYKEGKLHELAVYCFDPLSAEEEAYGLMRQDFIASAQGVVKDIKAGDLFFARFKTAPKMYLIEIVMRDGEETLEVADAGQPAEFKILRNLPEPG
jgi:hypothetical protein